MSISWVTPNPVPPSRVSYVTGTVIDANSVGANRAQPHGLIPVTNGYPSL